MFLNASVLKNATFSSSLKSSSSSYLSSKLTLQSKWERYKYQAYLKNQIVSSQDKEKKQPSVPKNPSKKLDIFISHRLKENISSLGKWNLAPLFSKDPHISRLLGELTANLLIELYSHTLFWKQAEKEEPKLAASIVHAFLENKASPETLSALFPANKSLQPVFYKMLKGSGSYDLLKKEGYPPLGDFFTFHLKENTLTNFPLASYFILKALFQDTVIESILSGEKSKWEKDQYLHSLTKEELRALCQGNALSVKGQRFQDIEPFLQFSHKRAKLEKITCTDKKTNVYLELSLPPTL